MLQNNFNTSLVSHNNPVSFIDKIRETEHSRQVDLKYLTLLDKPYKIRVAIYIRVSTLKQARDGKDSLPEQEAAIRLFVKSHSDWEIISIYNEGGSSGKELETRKQFEKMTADAKLGLFDVIVGWSTDRMARNLEEMTAYRKEMRLCMTQVTTVMEQSQIIDPRKLSTESNSKDKIMNLMFDWKAEADNETRVARFNLGK